MISFYSSSLNVKGMIEGSGSSSLTIENITFIYSETNNIDKNLISFLSSGNFVMENCLIKQYESLINK
jgi:hypothetical protein